MEPEDAAASASCEGDSTGNGGTDTSVIKSKAVVRFPPGTPRLSPYSRLKLNTDLRQPPPNWLKNGPTIQVPNTWIRGEPAEISSFGMADADILDDVDVISASENIKTLLKIPFSDDQVSLAVHRIGKTLLLDKLDFYKHLRSASQNERQWLKDVFIRLLQEEEGETPFQGQHKTTESLQTSNLLSKFLYHSLGSDRDLLSQPSYNVEEPEESQKPHLATAIRPLPKSPEDEVSQFARQVFWQFEDIRMLIGTDLPIFGGGNYPAVSLRLRDMKSPINILTGMDYWLDNLMCNVPELVMCYHLDGFVQRYELIKTEDIPKLENAQFSQKLVKDIAQNILSFINSNCTKEGHTYWLFKGQGDDVVKLYDLSSLMTQKPDCPWDNPYVVPVAMLLYRVAHNMSQTATTAKDKHIIVTLLMKCLALLGQGRDPHPEIVVSANYILCQMFMDDNKKKGKRGNTGSDDDVGSDWTGGSSTGSEAEDDDDDDEDDDVGMTGEKDDGNYVLPPIDIPSLKQPAKKAWKNHGDDERRRSEVKMLNASREEKALQTLEYVVRGLEVLKAKSSDGKASTRLPGSPTQAPITMLLPQLSPEKTSKAIPMPDRQGKEQRPPEVGGKIGGDGRGQSSSRQGEEEEEEDDHGCELSIDPFVKPPHSMLDDTQGTRQSESDGHRKQGEGESAIGGPSGGGASDEPRTLKEERTEDQIMIRSTRTVCQSEADRHGDGQSLDVNDPAGGKCGVLVPRVPSSDKGRAGGVACERAVVKEKSFPQGSWQETSGLLLLEKAYEAYCVLSEVAWRQHRHGKALLTSHLAIKCLGACSSIHDPDGKLCQLLAVAGDSHLLLTHDLENQTLHRHDYENLSEVDTAILEIAVLQQTSDVGKYERVTEMQSETEDCLEASIRCYKACLEEASKKGKAFRKNVSQKLGNACNELGVFFMNTAANVAPKDDSLPSLFQQELWKESYMYFDAGIKTFEEVADTTNVALLNSNMGRLMRLCAQSYGAGGSMGPKGEFSNQEKHYYVKAADCYTRALQMLGSKRGQALLHESITWELCTTYFNMACLLQDHPPISTQSLAEIEKVVLEGMSKALALCDTEKMPTSRQPLYQYRAATIHHRLASMYHNSNRSQSSQKKEKHTRSLSELHYTKAVKLFKELDRPVELLRVELERVALLEHQLEGQTGAATRFKTLEGALAILLGCRQVMPQLEKMSFYIVPSSTPSTPTTTKLDQGAAKQAESPAQRSPGMSGPKCVVAAAAAPASEVTSDPGVGRTVGDVTTAEVEDGERSPGGEGEGAGQEVGDGGARKEGGRVGNAPQGSTLPPVKPSTEQDDKVKGTEKERSKLGDQVVDPSDADCCKEQHEDSKVKVSGKEEGHEPQLEKEKKEEGEEKKREEKEEEEEEEDDNVEGSKSEMEEVKRLLAIFESRLQFVLLQLVKLSSSGKKRSQQMLSTYKDMYVVSLGKSSTSEDQLSLSSRLEDISRLSP
ncbi:erythroid differentiation-related factor 1-like [Diadema setosum]|uniref:erythroid differentiation-related factor 1-like n=1 Tax=Diadema setosum TaxID=31175 RepID=UPI003B3B5CCC